MKDDVVRLSDFDGDRRNNFTLLRIFFAWIVLYGHSYAIQKVPGVKDLLGPIFEGSTYSGRVAISGFFAISGFLVAASFINRGLIDYSISRALRIFPALFLCVFASIFILGPLFTNLSLSEYFSHDQTYNYLVNAVPFYNVEYILPGVFTENTRLSTNGSLWSLTPELRCYFVLAVVGFFGLLNNRTIANCTIVCIFLFGVFFFQDIPYLGKGLKIEWPLVSMYFLIGVFFYINRDKVIFSYRLAFLALLLMSASFGEVWFDYVFPVAFVYFIFWLAYFTPFINLDKKIGDFSYGLYIYAWPVQQSVAHVLPEIGPYKNMAISSVIVIFLALLSWHYVESPVLKLKGRLLGTWSKKLSFVDAKKSLK